MPCNYTINFKGEEKVAFETTGMWLHVTVTVMLCITKNGNKLPPHVILNIRTMQKKIFANM
jgi:hypothetical protein